MANAIISIIIRATDAASGAIKSAQDAATKASEASAKAIRNIGLALTALGIAGALVSKKLTDEFRSVDEASDALLISLRGNSDAHADLTAQARELAKTLPVAGGEMATLAGLTRIMRSGLFDASEASGVLERAIKLSEVTGSDLATTLDAMLSSVGAYGKENLSAADAATLLLEVFQKSNVSMEELSASMGRVLPLAKELGIDARDVAAAVTFLSSKGIDAGQSMGALGTFMTKMLTPTDEVKARFEALGVTSFPELVEKSGSLGLAMQALVEPIKDDSSAMAELFGDARSLKTILPLLTADSDDLESQIGDLGDSTHALDEAFQQVATDSSAAMDIAGNRISSALARIGASTSPAMASMRGALATGVEAFADLNDKTQGALGAVLAFGSAALSTIGPVVAMIAQLKIMAIAKAANAAADKQSVIALIAHKVALVASTVAAAAKTVAVGIATAAQWLWNFAMSANPIGIIILAIGALIAIIIFLVTHWQEVTAVLTAVWEFIKSKLVPVFDFLVAAVKGAIEVVAIFAGVAKKVWEVLSGAFQGLKDLLFGLGKWLLENVVLGIWNFVAGLPAAAWEIVKSFFNAFVDAFKGIFGRVFDLGKEFVKWIVKGILSFLGPLGDVVRPVLEAVLGPLTGSPWLKPEIADRFHRIGADMSKAIGAGILDGAGAAERAIGSSVGNLSASVRNSQANGAGGNSGTVVHIVFGRGSIVATDAKEFSEKVERAVFDRLRSRGIRVSLGV